MKKFFSMLAFAVIMFVATTVTYAAPNVTVQFTGVTFDSVNKTLTLYSTLTNSGDQDAEVDALNLAYLKLANGDTGEILFDGENVSLTIEPCLVKAGSSVEEVVWFLQTDYLPDHKGNTTIDWNGKISYVVR